MGLTRGGLSQAVLLSHYLDVPMHTLKVSLRDHDMDKESNLWMAADAACGKHILIVDDINDTGATIDWIQQDWTSSDLNIEWHKIWNNTVKFAVIVDNLSSKCGIKMDYTSLTVNKLEDPVWVDFPWENWWRR